MLQRLMWAGQSSTLSRKHYKPTELSPDYFWCHLPKLEPREDLNKLQRKMWHNHLGEVDTLKGVYLYRDKDLWVGHRNPQMGECSSMMTQKKQGAASSPDVIRDNTGGRAVTSRGKHPKTGLLHQEPNLATHFSTQNTSAFMRRNFKVARTWKQWQCLKYTHESKCNNPGMRSISPNKLPVILN